MIETVRPSRLRRIWLVVAALTTTLFGVAVVHRLPPFAIIDGMNGRADLRVPSLAELDRNSEQMAVAIGRIAVRNFARRRQRTCGCTCRASFCAHTALASPDRQLGAIDASLTFCRARLPRR